MSLNRYEQLLHDYLETMPDEKRYWKERVAELARSSSRPEQAVLRLNAELWDYFEERSRNEDLFSQIREAGKERISMLNLSELLLRIWIAPRKAPSARLRK